MLLHPTYTIRLQALFTTPKERNPDRVNDNLVQLFAWLTSLYKSHQSIDLN